MTTASGFLLNNSEKTFHTEHADRGGGIPASLISKMNLLFNENLQFSLYTTLQKQSDTRFQEAGRVEILSDVMIDSPTACVPAQTQEHKHSKVQSVGVWDSHSLFSQVSIFLHALSLLMMHLFPGMSTSLPLAGPPGSVFTL